MDKCKHPEDQREPYHDMTVKCCACNCVIEQFGKPIDPPSPLSPKIWPVESSREPACYESTSRSCVLSAIDEMAKAVSSLEQSIELLQKDAGKPTIENLRMAINKMSESAAYLNPHMIKDALRDS